MASTATTYASKLATTKDAPSQAPLPVNVDKILDTINNLVRVLELALTLPGADRTEALYHRGSCLIGIGDRTRGEADLRECRELGGHPEEVDGLLAQI